MMNKMQLEQEKFLIGQAIHNEREREWKEVCRRTEARKKSMEETDKRKLNINEVALDLLEALGFERSALGTNYLAELIETLYHERRAFDETSPFFDFDNPKNNHYVFVKEYFEQSVTSIQKNIDLEVAKSSVQGQSLNEIIYGVANEAIQKYDDKPKVLVYSRMNEKEIF